jgi:hypothetical protein
MVIMRGAPYRILKASGSPSMKNLCTEVIINIKHNEDHQERCEAHSAQKLKIRMPHSSIKIKDEFFLFLMDTWCGARSVTPFQPYDLSVPATTAIYFDMPHCL